MHGDEVVWFEEDYNAVRDGKKDHTGHSEVVTHLEMVKQSIEIPDEVRQDKDYKNRKCYYAWFSGGLDYPMNHMKTVIERTWYGKLRVVTAYFTRYINGKEVTLWTKT